MVKVEMWNSVSKVHCPPDILHPLRKLVSYEAQKLPPVPIQKVIRAAFTGSGSIPRRSREANLEALLSHYSTLQRLEAMGFNPGQLSARKLEAVLELRGEWDGWTTMVTQAGTFQTGLMPHVLRALQLRLGQEVHVQDSRHRPPSIERSLGFPPPLYDFQEEAVETFLQETRGTVAIPPRGGKTRIATAIVQRLKLPTLYVVPTIGLVDQTVAAMREFLDPDEVIGITGGKPNRKLLRKMAHARVWIATPPTAAGGHRRKKGRGSKTRPPGIANIDTRRVLIGDESHHSAADTYQSISLAAKNAYYRLFLTGTNYRADGLDMAMQAVTGKAIYEKTVTDMVDLGRLVPAYFAMVRVPGESVPKYLGGHDLRARGIVDHKGRNDMAAWTAHQLAERGMRVLGLTKEVRHAETVASLVPGAAQVDGRNSDDTYVKQALDDLAARRVRAVFGTSVSGEGRDVPAADAMVYLCGGRSRVKVMQDTFRVLTQSEGKKFAIVVDFADQHHPRLTENAAERLAIYRSIPCFESVVLDPEELMPWIDSIAARHAS